MQAKFPGYTLLLRNYFQYEALRIELLKLFYRNALEKGKSVDCYIDLNCFLRDLYRREYNIEDPMFIAASVINYCAYIREFFASRFDIYARIFIVYGNNRPQEIATIFPEYDAHNEMQRLTNNEISILINQNIEILEVLTPYIPDVFFIRDMGEEPAVLTRAMIAEQSKLGFKSARIIFSRDMYMFQVAATCPNTHIVRVKKTMQGDKTYTISFFDFYKKVYNQVKTDIGVKISPELYSLYMTLSGCKDRNIRSLVTLPKADQTIRGLIDTDIILNGYNHSLAVSMNGFEAMVNFIRPDPGLAQLLATRYQVFDLVHRTNIYNLSPGRVNLTKGYVNLYDPKAVRDISNQYFKMYPLDLNVF